MVEEPKAGCCYLVQGGLAYYKKVNISCSIGTLGWEETPIEILSKEILSKMDEVDGSPVKSLLSR